MKIKFTRNVDLRYLYIFFGAGPLFICSFAFLFVGGGMRFVLFAKFILTFHIHRGDGSNVSYVSEFVIFGFHIIICAVFRVRPLHVMLIHPKDT